MEDVAYAGPIDSAPKASPRTEEQRASAAAAPAAIGEVPLSLQANVPDVEFAINVGHQTVATARGGALVDDFAIVCIAPCTTTMRPGRYRIGLITNHGSATLPEDAVNVTDPGELHGEFTSRSGERIAG